MDSLKAFYEQPPPREVPLKFWLSDYLRADASHWTAALWALLFFFISLLIPGLFFIIGSMFIFVVSLSIFTKLELSLSNTAIILLTLFGGLFYSVVVVYLRGFIGSVRSKLRVLKNGTLTVGTVVRSKKVYEAVSDSDDVEYGQFVVRFFDGVGMRNEIYSTLFKVSADLVARFPEGTQVKVLHDPEKPDLFAVLEFLY